MDTYKDAVALNDLWASGAAPWRLWEHDVRTAPPAGERGSRRASPRSASALGASRRARNSATGSRMPRRRRSPANDQR